VSIEHYLVSVFDPVPMSSFWAASDVVRAGSTIELKIRLQDPAPASGTKMHMVVEHGDKVIQPRYLKGFLVIQPGSYGAQLNLPTLPDAPPFLAHAKCKANQWFS
jgi:hypothetical protein